MNDGGPVFPSTKLGEYSESYSGMTLRDCFASLANEEDIKEFQKDDSGEPGWVNEGKYSRIEARFRYADAMIAERPKETKSA